MSITTSSSLIIEDGAIKGCSTRCKSIIIPKDITAIWSGAFFRDEMNLFESIYFDGTIEDWFKIELKMLGASPLQYTENVFIRDTDGEYIRLRDIEIPDTVDRIPEFAFTGVRDLEKIYIPSSVKSIGESAFNRCPNLRTVHIDGGGNQPITIGNNSFYKCRNLSHIILGNTSSRSIIHLGEFSFSYCPNIERVDLLCNTLTYPNFGMVRERSPFTGSGSVEKKTQLVIHDNVKQIRSGVFADFTGLVKINGGTNLQYIGNRAFEYCSGLEYVNIFPDLVEIGSRAFYRCEALSNITFGSSLRTIDMYAFYANSFTSLDIPKSVEVISGLAFGSSNELQSISIVGKPRINAAAFEDGELFENSTGTAYLSREFVMHGRSSLKALIRPFMTIYFEGTMDEWTTATASLSAESLTNITVLSEFTQEAYRVFRNV